VRITAVKKNPLKPPAFDDGAPVFRQALISISNELIASKKSPTPCGPSPAQ
jgi:hypothetical protein